MQRRVANDMVILITGASSDIGLTLAQRFAELGSTIVAHYATNDAGLRNIKQGNIHPIQADLTSEAGTKELWQTVKSRYGRLDTLVNTIGPFQEYDCLTMTPAEWKKTIDLNLNVAFDMSHHSIPSLVETKGQILNFTYAGAENITAWPEAAAYSAAKAGLAVLTKSLAKALAPKNVRVNAMAPGWIDVGGFSPEKKREIEKQVPMNRLGHLHEVADLAQWIIFESPEYMTGAMIPLAGGLEF